MEKITAVKVFSVDYICDECNKGKMIFDGITLTTYPPLFPHTCELCKATKNLRRSYPALDYQNIKGKDMK